jgi:hypothetical protein
MSQHPSGHARVSDDFYAEPPECLLALIDAFGCVRDGFPDPAAGTGGGTIFQRGGAPGTPRLLFAPP